MMGEVTDDKYKAAVAELSDLYRRNDGTMRQCNYAPDKICLKNGCRMDGCHRANEILKAASND